MFLCGRKEEFSRTATSSKKGKTKIKNKKTTPKGNTILKLKLLLEHKHSSHRLGLSRTEVVQVQHTLTNWDTPTHHLKHRKESGESQLTISSEL